MREFALTWYGFLNSLYATIAVPFAGFTAGNGSILAALALGVLGALSPCQLSSRGFDRDASVACAPHDGLAERVLRVHLGSRRQTQRV